jgi:hypothetical protein
MQQFEKEENVVIRTIDSSSSFLARLQHCPNTTTTDGGSADIAGKKSAHPSMVICSGNNSSKIQPLATTKTPVFLYNSTKKVSFYIYYY